MVERRRGGETGVEWLQTYRGDGFWTAWQQGVWAETLVKAALCRSSTLAPASATHISQKAREIPRISCAQLWIG